MSILLVIVGHFHQSLIALAIFGVHIFFVISGYLITKLLQDECDRSGRINLGTFYRRRAFRIFPAAYTYIIIIVLLVPASRPGLPYAATYTVSYHFVTMPLLLQHLWSLSVEEQFYLLWPLALVLGYRYRGQIAWLAMLAAGLFRLALAFSSSPFSTFHMHYSFPGSMDSIAAGCLLAIYEPRIRARLEWLSEAAAIAIAIPITAWILERLWWGDTSIIGVRIMSAFWGVVPLLIGLWVFVLISRRDWIFNNAVASAIGVLSYSLYLWQQPFTFEQEYPKILALFMLTSCATASYFLIEKPMLRLGALLNSRKSVPAPRSADIQLQILE